MKTYEKTDIQSQFDGEPIVRLNGILMSQSAAEEIIARDQAHDAMLARFAASRILMVRAGRTSVRLVRIGGDTGMAALMATIAAHQYNYLWENAALDGDEA